MLKAPAFLGVSMLRRKNRRWLVVVTYAVFLGLMATAIISLPLGGYPLAMVLVAFACLFVNSAVFGRLVKDTVLLGKRGLEIASLGLTGRGRRSEDELDEREVAMRNVAVLAAYRVLAWYSLFVWAELPFIFKHDASSAPWLIPLLAMPLLAVAFTLPQAVVLWTEPDLPEEARG
jgi:hypothetical protein